MSWLDDFKKSMDGGSDWSDATNDASDITRGSVTDSAPMENPLDYFISDLQESINLTGNSSSAPESSGVPSSSGDYTSGTNFSVVPETSTSNGFSMNPSSSVVNTLFKNGVSDPTWTDGFRDFIKNNQKDLLKLGFGVIQGISAESSRQKTVAAQAQSQIDQITLKDKLEQDKSKRISDSVKGLAPVNKWGAKPLKRLDGSNVFQPSGLINTYGAK